MHCYSNSCISDITKRTFNIRDFPQWFKEHIPASSSTRGAVSGWKNGPNSFLTWFSHELWVQWRTTHSTPVKKQQCILNWSRRFDERPWSPLYSALYLRKRWYLLSSCLSSRQRPLPFPNDFVSEEVVIWPLWALIRLECLIRVTPPGLRQETGQCMCGGREELCTVRLRARWTVCVWVFTLVSTPKLWPGTNRITAHQKTGWFGVYRFYYWVTSLHHTSTENMHNKDLDLRSSSGRQVSDIW